MAYCSQSSENGLYVKKVIVEAEKCARLIGKEDRMSTLRRVTAWSKAPSKN